MPSRWLMWLGGTWVFGALIGGIMEKVKWAGQDMSMLQSMVPTSLGSIFNPAQWLHWSQMLWRMATFDYVFLTSTWWGTIIRYVFLVIGGIIIAMVVWNLVGMFRGTAVSSD